MAKIHLDGAVWCFFGRKNSWEIIYEKSPVVYNVVIVQIWVNITKNCLARGFLAVYRLNYSKAAKKGGTGQKFFTFISNTLWASFLLSASTALEWAKSALFFAAFFHSNAFLNENIDSTEFHFTFSE